MKQYIFLLLLLSHLASFAQTDCPFYQKYMNEGNAELKKGAKANFTLAIDAFSTAMTHCPDKSAEARKGIDAAFAAINDLKIQADKNAKDAKEAAKKAKESAELAQKREVEAQTAKKELNDKLEKIKAANQGLVSPLIKLFDGFINDIDYQAAKDILEKAVEIDRQLNYAGKETFTYAYLQLIYYHTECGRLRLATQLSKAMLLYRDEKDKLYTSGDTLQYLQTLLKDYAKTEDLEKLHNRYYPTMIKVEGGTFAMAENYHVFLSYYEIAETELTCFQYVLFCDASGYKRPDALPKGNNPIINVSWGDAAAYNNWLTKRQNVLYARNDSLIYTLDGKTEWEWKDVGDCSACKTRDKEIEARHRPTLKGYRLPTEAEWQFAAAGGKTGISNKYKYAGSDNIEEVAWYSEISESHSHNVATKKKNELGLYDMSGNVCEWCQDWFNDYPKNVPAAAPIPNPYSDISGGRHILRGGSWHDDAGLCRVVCRDLDYPNNRTDYYGFRPARTL